jgi:transposase
VHSRYWRTIADLPWEGIPVRIRLQARKFFCLDQRCSRTIFTEQLPGSVEVISRDRAGSFADAINQGAPRAVQVADRWHLLNNLIETLGRSLEHHRRTLNDVRKSLEKDPAAQHTIDIHSEEPPTQALRRKQEKRQHRLERYEQMRSLIDGGMNQSEVARQLGLSLRTIQRWTATGAFPERKQRVFPTAVDAFGSYLERRFAEGCVNAPQLWREIRQQGFTGRAFSVWAWLRHRFGRLRNGLTRAPAKKTLSVSPQHVAWLMLKGNTSRYRYLKALYRASPELAALGKVARELFDILKQRDAAAWPRWLEAAAHSPLASFARRLARDQHAVHAALQLPWSNDMVEGQIHRLKSIKRQMYGRAGFDLLRLRVLHSA